uniref:Junctional cadherin 5 associated a n=1 Tax=Hippocampus comes TaxID=109280 RepID=A0A3Q2Y8W0_HIPCM
MAGQKNLHPSSNSAFSRLGSSPTPQQASQPSEQRVSSPSKHDSGDPNTSSPKKSNSSPPECPEQVAFGQFLLKPVNRRPFDAIGELETINKEMEDTISKRRHVGRSVDDLDGMNKRNGRYRSGPHFLTGLEAGREARSLPPTLTEKAVIKIRSKSFPSANDLESVGTRQTFSRPQTNIPFTDEICAIPSPGGRRDAPSLPQHSNSNRLYRQDIPVPQESLLRDVGLTVYTETPSGGGETTQRSLPVSRSLDHADLTVQTKAKSQSMPRMLRPESLRVNGHPLSHQDLYRAPRWPENGRPASANQLSVTPKPRFTRPPRPPSYEMHQQIRGSCELLSGRDSVISHTRDRTPIPIIRTGDAPLDYFAQDSGPPGYIPPPSYKRAPVIIGGRRGYGEIAVDYRYRGDVYQQIHVAPDGTHWITRHPAGSWSESSRERCIAGHKQLHPVCTSQEHPGGKVQYISFDDPRIRHISSRWHSHLHKATVDHFSATDQNCNTYSKNRRPPPSPSSAFQAPVRRAASRQGSSLDQVFAETITQVKKIVPESGLDNNRNTKRRVSETIFCLVLVHYSHFHTTSTSSLRNSKRAPLRKEIIDAWALQANEDKEMCYSGSWPGNQYRNQETQTGSPLTVVKSPELQSPPGAQEPVHSSSDTPTDSGVGTDNGSSYGYPMAGQKNLHPSSNSAFSRLGSSPTPQQASQPSEQRVSSPSKHDSGDPNTSSPKKSNSSPPECPEQVAFGQFLLKPVNRRPFDAIGELETINKEMEDTISKSGGGETTQRSLPVSRSLDHADLTVQLSSECGAVHVKNCDRAEHSFDLELQDKVETETKAQLDKMPQSKSELNLSINGSRSEMFQLPKSHSSPLVTQLTEEVSHAFKENGNDKYCHSEPLKYNTNESTIADVHLETLLTQEKANALPAEDLSSLYEVQCAKGIPENESIEQRAARILGIPVPMETLGVSEKNDDAETQIDETPHSPGEGEHNVLEGPEQVEQGSAILLGTEMKEVQVSKLGKDRNEDSKQKHNNNHHDGEHSEEDVTQSAVVLDLPEFPPCRLSLSLPVTPDEKLPLRKGEKKCSTTQPSRKFIEALQDKLSSSANISGTSLGRSTTDRIARLKELQSVSRIRRLSLKGSDSSRDCNSEERDGDRRENLVEGEATREVEEKQEHEEGPNAQIGRRKEEDVDSSVEHSYDPSRVERV